MKVLSGLLCASALLLQVTSAARAEEQAGEFREVVALECHDPSPQALELFGKISDLIGYQGRRITYCKTSAVRFAKAEYLQTAIKPHPYIKWKKQPVIEPYIHYNSRYINQMEYLSGTRYSGVAIMAYQIGQLHISEHERAKKLAGMAPEISHHPEYFMALALARMGAKTADLKAAQRVMYSVWNDLYDLRSEERIDEVVQGWRDGGGEAVAMEELAGLSMSVSDDLQIW